MQTPQGKATVLKNRLQKKVNECKDASAVNKKSHIPTGLLAEYNTLFDMHEASLAAAKSDMERIAEKPEEEDTPQDKDFAIASAHDTLQRWSQCHCAWSAVHKRYDESAKDVSTPKKGAGRSAKKKSERERNSAGDAADSPCDLTTA